MPIFDKKDFNKVLEQVEQGTIAPVYLLHGEPYLVKSALGRLAEILVPPSQQSTNLEVVDGGQADFRQILDSLNTFALFAGRKAVLVQECRLFYSKTNLPALFGKSKEAYEAGDLEAAALLLLEVLSHAGWSITDVAAGAWREIPPKLWRQTIGDEHIQTEMEWLDEALEHAGRGGMQVPERSDDAALLEGALEHGFPPEQCLVLTSDTVDKRRSLFRLLEAKGVVVDFSVASGTSRQARSQQETVLKNLAREMLSQADKTMEPTALALLLERTGFNLWALKTQMEKLTSFVGEDTLITSEHVLNMTDHFREEALYELNNAVASRDCAASLVVLNRLMEQGFHPLQLLASLTNEIRRLLVAREFITTHLKGRLDPSISFGKFQKSIYPVIKTQAVKDSFLVTAHPFALHKTMVRSAALRASDLINSLHHLFVSDVILKSTGLPQRAVMESLIISLCQSHHGDAETR